MNLEKAIKDRGVKGDLRDFLKTKFNDYQNLFAAANTVNMSEKTLLMSLSYTLILIMPMEMIVIWKLEPLMVFIIMIGKEEGNSKSESSSLMIQMDTREIDIIMKDVFLKVKVQLLCPECYKKSFHFVVCLLCFIVLVVRNVLKLRTSGKDRGTHNWRTKTRLGIANT